MLFSFLHINNLIYFHSVRRNDTASDSSEDAEEHVRPRSQLFSPSRHIYMSSSSGDGSEDGEDSSASSGDEHEWEEGSDDFVNRVDPGTTGSSGSASKPPRKKRKRSSDPSSSGGKGSSKKAEMKFKTCKLCGYMQRGHICMEAEAGREIPPGAPAAPPAPAPAPAPAVADGRDIINFTDDLPKKTHDVIKVGGDTERNARECVIYVCIFFLIHVILSLLFAVLLKSRKTNLLQQHS
jgi:hypothetical protein